MVSKIENGKYTIHYAESPLIRNHGIDSVSDLHSLISEILNQQEEKPQGEKLPSERIREILAQYPEPRPYIPE